MAAINFPASPANGALYTDATNKEWVYNSSKKKWRASSMGAGTTQSATAPLNPRDGAGWLDTGTGILSFWSDAFDAWIAPANYALSLYENAYLNADGDTYVNADGAYYATA